MIGVMLGDGDVETDMGSSFLERTYRRRRGKGRPLRDHGGLPRLARPKGCVAARRGRSAAGPAWLVKAPWTGPDGRTNPLRHRPLYTDSPSRAAPHTRTAGPWDRSCPRHPGGAVAVRHLGAEMCRCHRGHVGVCTRAQVTAVPL